jgi:glutathione S-transferase
VALTLYYHPLASFCWKALIALYENDTAFEALIVELGEPASRADFVKVWPFAKFPVLRDATRSQTVAESTTIIEYLDAFYPGRTRFIPAKPDQAWQTRMWDRVYDSYVHQQMQKIVVDRLRPENQRDALGVEQARAQLREAYAILDRRMEGSWTMEDAFTLADCAAAPALFYANTVVPFPAACRNLPSYLTRLIERPSFARVLEEAEPYFALFPMEQKPVINSRAAASR